MMKIDAGDNRHPDKILKCRPEIAYPLYIEGSLIPEDAGGVAIVGSRKPSLYGIKMAQAVAQKAVMNSKTVISGLARVGAAVANGEIVQSGFFRVQKRRRIVRNSIHTPWRR